MASTGLLQQNTAVIFNLNMPLVPDLQLYRCVSPGKQTKYNDPENDSEETVEVEGEAVCDHGHLLPLTLNLPLPLRSLAARLEVFQLGEHLVEE